MPRYSHEGQNAVLRILFLANKQPVPEVAQVACISEGTVVIVRGNSTGMSEQAVEMLELLDQLRDQLWETYGDQIVAQCMNDFQRADSTLKGSIDRSGHPNIPYINLLNNLLNDPWAPITRFSSMMCYCDNLYAVVD